MGIFLSVIAALLVLSVFVVLHEFGHYMAGRKLGFKVMEFAVGMGPAIFKIKGKKTETTFVLRAIPIGGMCRFYGEDESATDELSFMSHAAWKRFVVVVSGSLMNILTAVILAAVVLIGYGDYVPSVQDYTFAGSPAEKSGLLVGDIIIGVDGKRVEYYEHSLDLIKQAEGGQTTLTVLRNDEEAEVVVTDIYDEEQGKNVLGVLIGVTRLKYGFFDGIVGSFRFVGSMAGEMFEFLGGIFSKGVSPGDVMGPVGTISLIGQAVRTGMEMLLRLAIMISINLGIINLLPLPALDGGRIIFVIIELLRGKPIKPEREGMVHFIGIVMLLGLMVLLTVTDVARIFGG